MKRKERKHLKSNEFAEFMQRAIHFFREHTREFAAAAGVAALAVLIFLGVRYIQAQQMKKQSQILAQINQLSEKLPDDPQKLEELESLAGKGKFARAGYIHIAAYHIENGDYEKAVEAVEKIPGSPKDIIYYQSREIKALSLWKQKKYEKALEVFELIEMDDPKNYVLDGVLFKKAEMFREMGKKEEAIEVFKRITENYSNTYYAMEAQQELTKLEGSS